MDYYERRARATKVVDSLLKKRIPASVIANQIERDYGLGLKFVKMRIESNAKAKEALKDVPKREISSQAELP